ncbi:hypothetical protein AN477_04845 [Alicyclobacillus ferrooxydans]|uniref:Transcriptional regulator n=1 Tax=Alicyclobacillus ferrooxydans TaxID=471514 RepID=A0A0P9CHJ7_9BACL|nr:hypothetical protein AN477_04845 [Alicyclobacillus ferrooxydans]
MYTVGIDVGGTKIATAVVDADGQIIESADVLTKAEQGPEAVLDRIVNTVEAVLSSSGVSSVIGVGIGAPGPLNPREGMVYSPPNLPGWDRIPLQAEMQRRLHLPTFLDNDANAAALAELRFGAGSGYRDMVYLTISTGIGGGVILDGKIRQGASGCAAEVGHHIIALDGPLCRCGNRGCLEVLASGTAIARMAEERLGAQLNASAVARLAAQGDSGARAILDDVYRYLGVGLVNVVNMFDPSVIVIGGGVAQIGEPLFEALQQSIDQNHFRSNAFSRVRVLPAQLGTRAGVIGAALLPLVQSIS